ncbi:MAG: cold-shock protein [Gemmatimonadales bacterium]
MPRSAKPSGRRRGHRTTPARPPRERVTPAVTVTDAAGLLTPAESAWFARRGAQLARYFPRVLAVAVTVGVPHRRLHEEAIRYRIRIRVSVPLRDLVVRRQSGEQLRTAAEEAFTAARRLVQDYTRRHHRPERPSNRAQRGTVARLLPYEGYGFLLGDDGSEVYFHRNAVLGDGFDDLERGAAVRFTTADGRKGLQASTVAPD